MTYTNCHCEERERRGNLIFVNERSLRRQNGLAMTKVRNS